jgi:hypothetical protein
MRVTIDGDGRPVAPPTVVPTAVRSEVAGIASSTRILLRGSGDQPSAHAVLTLEWARDLQRALGPPTTSLPR